MLPAVKSAIEKMPTVKYATLDISKCEVEITAERTSAKGRARRVKTIMDKKNGIVIRPTDRFWRSFFHEYKLGSPADSFFDYFSYAEVFDRIKQRADNPLSAICLEYVPGTNNIFKGYGISRTNSATRFDDLLELYSSKADGLKDLSFDNGVITATYSSKDPISAFEVAGDKFDGTVAFNNPIDGFGHHHSYLGAERLVCANGMTAITPVFRSQFKLGESSMETLKGVIDGYRNEDGFIQLKKRFENAGLSYVSMKEVFKINKLFQHLQDEETGNAKLSRAIFQFSEMLGDFTQELGIASFDMVSDKVAAGIPMRPTVLEMIQLLTETSTHYLEKHKNAVRVNTYLGNLMSNNYDLELSKSHMGEYDAYLAKH